MGICNYVIADGESGKCYVANKRLKSTKGHLYKVGSLLLVMVLAVLSIEQEAFTVFSLIFDTFTVSIIVNSR